MGSVRSSLLVSSYMFCKIDQTVEHGPLKWKSVATQENLFVSCTASSVHRTKEKVEVTLPCFFVFCAVDHVFPSDFLLVNVRTNGDSKRKAFASAAIEQNNRGTTS